MAVLRFDLPDLCDCGHCGPKCGTVCGTKCICGPVIEKRTSCGIVKKIIPACHHHVVPVNPMPQVYLDYQNMCDVWYGSPGSIELTKINPLTYQIGIPPSLRGKLKIKVDMVQDCPRRRRKEETYTINLNFDDE